MEKLNPLNREIMTMKTHVHVSMISLAIAGLLSGQVATADTATDRGLMQCFYECKLNQTGSFFQEQTTLMIMNGNQGDTAAGAAHPVTHIANLVFINGNEQVLGKAAVRLTPRDLDEVNICATILRNTGGSVAALPPAGLVQIAIDNELLSGPGQFVPGNGVDVAIKNPVGRMSLTDPEVFRAGRITGVGKTSCFEIDDRSERLVFDPEVQAAPEWKPVLIENTEDQDTPPNVEPVS